MPLIPATWEADASRGMQVQDQSGKYNKTLCKQGVGEALGMQLTWQSDGLSCIQPWVWSTIPSGSNVCYPSTWVVEVGRLEVQGQPGLCNEFEASMGQLKH